MSAGSPQTRRAQPAPFAAEFAGRGLKALVVDDNADTRRLLELHLNRLGIATVFAADGASARSVARAERPDVVVLDLRLGGEDGLDVLRWLKGLGGLPLVPVVVITAADAWPSRQLAEQAGAAAFLQKPLHPGPLAAALRGCDLIRDQQEPMT